MCNSSSATFFIHRTLRQKFAVHLDQVKTFFFFLFWLCLIFNAFFAILSNKDFFLVLVWKARSKSIQKKSLYQSKMFALPGLAVVKPKFQKDRSSFPFKKSVKVICNMRHTHFRVAAQRLQSINVVIS